MRYNHDNFDLDTFIMSGTCVGLVFDISNQSTKDLVEGNVTSNVSCDPDVIEDRRHDSRNVMQQVSNLRIEYIVVMKLN